MKKIIFSALIMLVAASIVGCCPCRLTRKNAKPFQGTTWHLIQLSGRDVHFDNGVFDITFGANNKLTGIGACNRFSASYKSTDKEALDIDVIASTRMLCPDIETEQKLFKELDEATHYEIDGSMLLLLNNGEIRAIFSAVTTDTAADK